MSATPSSSKAEATLAPTLTDEELEKLLSREASAFNREVEVERILKAFKLNPYDILDIDESATQEEIKKRYRQLSLFIHPDKTPHARAPEAFDLLKKAESELSDKDKREDLDAVIKQARSLVLKALNLPLSTADNDPQLKGLQPPFKVRLRLQSKELLIDEEVRRRKAIKMNLANEGLEARKKDEEAATKKRKAQEDKLWEDTREQRVDSWRTFTKETRKKKKPKVAILG
ncbi:putative dnaJ molecular chaperone homology domain [Lyophyllum shimeji]|uniref:DnaJ molecular chaperone homology domain n=1 Tax=Lyophyllum shimeji TaxID=47721 RepID=A0A9P3PRQ5_LYOSH|nr:putative dnaJ molecular chaperone homology domain [Lyophyllum shimeji]